MSHTSNVDKIDLDELIKDFQIKDLTTFSQYLLEIWRDLARRSTDQSRGIEKLTFSNYYELPGIINDRLFSVFDKNKNGYLDPKEFIEGMTLLFSETFRPLASFVFKFYDFDTDGFITKEDVRVVLSYVPLQKKYSKLKMKYEQEDFKDRVESQNELFDILNKAFGEKEQFNEREFINVIENVSSDIFIFILMFLLEKRPFSDETIKIFMQNKRAGERCEASKTPKPAEPQKIASPSLKSKFISPTLKKRTIRLGQTNILNLYTGTSTASQSKTNQQQQQQHGTTNPYSFFKQPGVDSNNNIKHKSGVVQATSTINTSNVNVAPSSASTTAVNTEQPSKQSKKPQRRLRKMLENLDDTAPSTSSTACAFSQVKQVDQDNNTNNTANDNDSDSEHDEDPSSHPLVQHEGYMYKLTHSKKLKKVFFKLIGKDFYYFKNKEDPAHKGMHNLSGIYITEGGATVVEDKSFFYFSIIYPKKARSYYIENEAEYKEWLNKLNLAINYKSLLDQYEVKEKAGKGKFGLVKLAKHKETGRKVAIKIMAKKTMSVQDLELAKTEIDILKVSQHPNIIKLYDVLHTVDYIYIVMEYCGGGDLFSYIEQRGYKLPEPRACEIIHKLSMAIYYIHSYGIVHRDLKPENILMTDKSETADIRLLDFGLSKIIGPGEKCNEPFGTLSYVAPEVLKEKPYDKSVDLWSIGIIAYLLLCGFLPFDDEHSEREIARQTIQDPVPYPSQIWGKLSKEARHFVEALLKKNPAERMSITDVLEHEWIKKYSKVPEMRQQRSGKKWQSMFSLYTSDTLQNE